MPYISYEKITRQQNLNKMIEKICKEHKEQEKDPEIRDADQVVFRYSRHTSKPGSWKNSRDEEGDGVDPPTSPEIIITNPEETNQ